jgi:hypothetical protein
MKVGDLVKAQHWGTGYIGLVVSIRSRRGAIHGASQVCRVMINTGVLIDQLVRDLEVINESR